MTLQNAISNVVLLKGGKVINSPTRPTNLKAGDIWNQTDSSNNILVVWEFDGTNFYTLDLFNWDITFTGTASQSFWSPVKRSSYSTGLLVESLFVNTLMTVDPSVTGNAWTYNLYMLNAANSGSLLATGNNSTGTANNWLSQTFPVATMIPNSYPILRFGFNSGAMAAKLTGCASISYRLMP
jgi:hypothetical protein